MAKQRKKPTKPDKTTKTRVTAKGGGAAKPAQQRPAPPAEQWSIYRTISWWALLALVFLTPVAMANLTFLGFQLPLTFDQFDILKLFVQRVLGLVAFAAWAWDIALYGGKIRRTPVDWLILAFLAWVALSTILSIHPPTALFGKYRRFEGMLSFLNYALIYFLTLQFADRPSRLRRLAQTLFWSGIVVAGYGVMQSLGRDIVTWGRLPFEVNRAFSTYGNPDLLTGFLMFSVFVSLGLALAEERLSWRAVYWLGFLLNMWCLIVAFARSGWVGSVVGFTFIAILTVRQRVSWKSVDWVFSGAVGAVVAAVIVKSLSNPNQVMNFGTRVASIFQFGEGSAKTRFEIWQAARAAIQARPVFGFGPDTFRLVFPKYKPFAYSADAGYLSVADNVHNYPLQLAAGIGVLGMLMLYSIFGWAAIRSWRVVFTDARSTNRMILAGFWAASAAYVTHLFFGLSVTGTSFLMWTSMAAVLAPTAVSVAVKPPKWGVIAASGLTILAVLGIGFQVRFTAADNAYLMANIGSTGTARTEYAIRATRLNPFNDIYRAEVGMAYFDELLAGAQSLGAAGDQAQAQATVRRAFDLAERSLLDTIAFVPSEYDNYVFLSNLYNFGGQLIDPAYYDKSIEVATRGVVDVEPYGPALRLQLARALNATGKVEQAIAHLKFALRLDPRFTDGLTLLTEIYRSEGRTSEAISMLRDIDARAPGQQRVTDELARLEASATTTP